MREAENEKKKNGANALEDSPLYEETYRVKERRGNVRFFSVLLAVLLCFTLLRGVFSASFARIDVDGNSMLPTLNNGNALLMQYTDGAEDDFSPFRITKTPQRGDVVILDVRKYHDEEKYQDILAVPFDSGVNFLIKRLVGVGGDTIKEEDGRIYVLSAEDKAAGKSEFSPLKEQPENVAYNLEGCVYKLGAGEILILGDNTENSVDGRWLQQQGNTPSKKQRSHLNCAYKTEDICGVVPNWAVALREVTTALYR